jgi:hypothetical protein
VPVIILVERSELLKASDADFSFQYAPFSEDGHCTEAESCTE